MRADPFLTALSKFGASAKSKLSNIAAAGSPEDQLRAPLEVLTHSLAALVGIPEGELGLVGESSLSELKTRPDYAVVVRNALVGFIEVKAPGKGADPRRFSDPHDREQWQKLRSLPNLLYTDGNAFSLWRDGALQGAVIHLDGDIETAGANLSGSQALLSLFTDFLQWAPVAPRSAKQLAEVSARLCRLLREEVLEQLDLQSVALTELAKDWRVLLFPEATDDEFADGYAQAVTFGLLVARARNISLADGIDHAAQALRQTNSLIGTALRLLTDDSANQAALTTSLGTLTRVLDVVEWSSLARGEADAWLYFYEDFLEVYDRALRKRTGSYYTPPEVVRAMVRLVDDALRSPQLFDRALGLASADVTVADPAAGTGTFLLGILRRIAATIEDDQGAGAVPAAIASAAHRLVGFELQFGPYAVAQLRLLAEMQTLMTSAQGPRSTVPELRLFITDTLGNPFAEEERLPQILQPIGKSRRDANAVKRGEPITVVIGNPPYKEKAKGRGGWIEQGSDGREAPMTRWTPPASWGVGAHTKHLKNLYVYFWRWATWKVFGTGLFQSTGLVETERAGIVCFITVAGFLNGPGFQKMRDDLRRSCSDIWVVDCSPEGHQPAVSSRIFQGVQQPVCIVLAARTVNNDSEQAAHVRFRFLPEGSRHEKFSALANLTLGEEGWSDCPTGWRDPFLPARGNTWESYPALDQLFVYNGSGVMPGRTWVVSPDPESLRARWVRLQREASPEEKEKLFHPQLRNGVVSSRHIRKVVTLGLGSNPTRAVSVLDDKDPCVEPVRYGFRSFDRQWVIPDARLLNDTRPVLWNNHSHKQIYLTALERTSPSSGPAVTLTELIPDQDHYKGSFGGRVYPLWGNADASQSNIRPALLSVLSAKLDRIVTPEDMMAYVAAVMAHPGFTKRFERDLVRPGLRLPITSDVRLFARAVEIGSEVIWLQTFGDRLSDPSRGRPAGAPRLPRADAPRIPAGGAIPSSPNPLPEQISYDAAHKRLNIGGGFIDNVSNEVWQYEVSGKKILRQWFSYRGLDRSRPVIGERRPPSELDRIQPESWSAEYTTDLLDLLNVLGRLVILEPSQLDLLDEICSGSILSMDELDAMGAFAAPAPTTASSPDPTQGSLDFA